MKQALLLFLILLNVILVSAQNQAEYEILENDPTAFHKILLFISPVGMTVSNNTNVHFGIRGSYNHKDKFLADVDFRRSYTERINAYFNDFDNYSKMNQYGEPITSLRNLMLIEINGQYLLGSNIKNGSTKIQIYSGYNYRIYIRTPVRRFIAFPVRGGYSYYQSVMSTREVFMFESSPFYGKAVNDPNATPKAIHGLANFGAHLLNLGVGVYVRDDITINVHHTRPEFKGIRIKKESIYCYADIMIPMYQKIENINYIEKTNSTNGTEINKTEYNVNNHTRKTKYGYRLGMRWTNDFDKGLGVIWVESGSRPGPTDPKTNFFVICGIDVAVFKRGK